MGEIIVAVIALVAGGVIAYGWRQEALAQNALEGGELGKQLYERIASLAGRLCPRYRA